MSKTDATAPLDEVEPVRTGDALDEEVQEAPPPDAGGEQQAEEPKDGAETEQDERGGREAAKYRRRAQKAETERDEAREHLDAARRQLVEWVAGRAGVRRPEALWAAGVEVANLLDESGRVDNAKVQQAVQDASQLLGLARTPRPNPAQGVSESGAPEGFLDALSSR